MQYLTLDFETYYDKSYALSKKDMTTQDYIMDGRFEALMVSLKWGDQEAYAVEAQDIAAHFAGIDWTQVVLINHNAIFDASILWWRYGHRPAMIIDTMSMAQCLGVPLLVGSASLGKCIQLLREAGYDVPEKGDEVVSALGKRRKDFTPAQWEAYKQYCLTDSNITWYLFKVLKQYVPNQELQYQDMILRCYTEPMLQVHQPTVEYELARAKQYKIDQLAELCQTLGVTHDALLGELRSNDKFVYLLRQYGGASQAEIDVGAPAKFVIPQKVSERTGKLTWALGKNDVAFKALCEIDDPTVQILCQSRLAAKSSIDETRAATFLKYASYGFLPMGYKIGGAHTNRMSGGSAGCLTADTMVLCLTNDGDTVEKPIVDVLITDLVWDGVEWCEHDGVVFSGMKEVMEYDGIRGTPCHQVFTSESTSCRLDSAAATGTPIMDCPLPPNWKPDLNGE